MYRQGRTGGIIMKQVYIFHIVCENQEEKDNLEKVCRLYCAEINFLHNTSDGELLFEVLTYDKRHEELILKMVHLPEN